MGGGGGTSSPRIIRPNLELIIKLRGGALAGPRPQEIRKIAVIDDESMIVRTTIRTFKGICPVEEIAEPRQFMTEPDLLARLGFDAAFVDHDMPGLNVTGSQIMKLARDSGYSGFLIGMTGRLNDNMPAFYEAGADLVLPKPLIDFSLKDLFSSKG